jgi:hypothetical protein
MLDHWTSVQAALDGSRGHAPEETAARRQALDWLISAQWKQEEANEYGIRVGDGEVQHQLGLFVYEHIEAINYEPAVRDAMLVRVLLGAGVPASDRRWAMKLAILDSRIELERIKRGEQRVTVGQIASYYRAQKRLFFVPEERDYDIVESFSKPSMEEAKREIEAGKSFRSVAARMSIDTRAPGGRRINQARGDGAKSLDDAIFRARPGVLVGPKIVATYYLFRVIRVWAAHERSLAEVQASIRRRLGERLAATVVVAESARRWAAKTRCLPGRWAASCRRYTHNLLVGLTRRGHDGSA